MSATSTDALVISEEPEANFWKDEGGRSNKLRMVVRHPMGSDLDIDVPLAFELYYESGRVVEARDQNILNLCKPDYDPWTIQAGVGEAEVEFRLEKVSRRKDGQRFRVAIRPAAPADGAKAHAFAAEEVFTRAICVMSKRRTGERVVSRRAPARAAASASYSSSAEDIDQLHSLLNHMAPTLDDTKQCTERVFQTVIAMSSRINSLEQIVARLAAASTNQQQQQQQQQLVHAGSYAMPQDPASSAALHGAGGRSAQLQHLTSTLSVAPQMSTSIPLMGPGGPTTSAGYAPMQSHRSDYRTQVHASTPQLSAHTSALSGAPLMMVAQHSGLIQATPSQIIPGMAGPPPPLPAQITAGSTGSTDMMAPMEPTSRPRRSTRRAAQLKRDRSADALLSAAMISQAMPLEPRLAATSAGAANGVDDDDDDYNPKQSARQSSAEAAAKAAAEEDDAEMDPSALMSAASAQAFNPASMQQQATAGPGMARLPSIASGVIDRLTSREFDGLDALSSAASSQSKRPKRS